MLGKMGLREALQRGEILLEEVREEVKAQILLFSSFFPFSPSHLDSHQHVSFLLSF